MKAITPEMTAVSPEIILKNRMEKNVTHILVI
jgi:hypothetical protein